MKISEVCERTGLTERTVRFYAQQKLVFPARTRMNGREYSDWSEQDLRALMTVAELRRAFFSLDEIRGMMEAPSTISRTLQSYLARIEEDAQAKAAIAGVLRSADPASLRDVRALADKLKGISTGLPLPALDLNPNFGRFDEESQDEKALAFTAFQQKQDRQYRLGRAIVFTIATLNLLTALVSAVLDFNFFTLLIQIALSIALYSGVSWIRWLFAAGAALTVFLTIAVLIGALGPVSLPDAGTLVFLLLYMVYSAVSAVLLIKSKSVTEFLYAQKNG